MWCDWEVGHQKSCILEDVVGQLLAQFHKSPLAPSRPLFVPASAMSPHPPCRRGFAQDGAFASLPS